MDTDTFSSKIITHKLLHLEPANLDRFVDDITTIDNLETMVSSRNDPIVTLPNNIVLRPWQLHDIESSAKHMNNRKVWICMRDGIPSPYTDADAVWWIANNLKGNFDAPSGPWTLEANATGPKVPANYAIVVNGEAVGGIGLMFGTNVYRRTAELGYWLGEEHWGKGVMSSVVAPFLDWAWKTFETLVRIDSGCYDFNERSAGVLRKVGFEYEGHRRNNAIKDGKICGELMFGLLRPEQ